MNKREDFLIYLMQFIRLPYIWGGDNPKVGLDCSGLVQLALARLNLDPPGDQTADGLLKFFENSENGKHIAQPYLEADLGDLVFFGLKERATHVAIVLTRELMLEAAGGTPACTTPAIANKIGSNIRVSQLRRRSDRLTVIRPLGLNWGI